MSTQNLANRGPMRQKCKKYPECKDPNCKSIHPTKMCAKLPNCKYGQNCFDIHPLCENDGTCKLPGCIFTHMKQKPVPLPRPQPEKQPQQFKKKESPVDEIRAKVNEVKELASKSDLVMQGHLEQVLMKLSLLEKDIENDKKNLTAQMGKNSRLEKQLKEANEKIQKLSNSNMDKNLNSNLQTHIPLFPPPTSSFSNRQSSSNIPIKNVPVFSPPHGMTPPVPHVPVEIQRMTLGLQSQLSSGSDLRRIQEEKHQTEKHLEDVLHNNLTLLEQNDRLQKQIEALQKKSY